LSKNKLTKKDIEKHIVTEWSDAKSQFIWIGNFLYGINSNKLFILRTLANYEEDLDEIELEDTLLELKGDCEGTSNPYVVCGEVNVQDLQNVIEEVKRIKTLLNS
jgi:hypothetical protein